MLHSRHIIEVLERHRVDDVRFGGYAATIYGARRPTYDIDITPATTPENLSQLAAALREPEAGIRVDQLPDGLPFDASAEALLGMRMLNLRARTATSISPSSRPAPPATRTWPPTP